MSRTLLVAGVAIATACAILFAVGGIGLDDTEQWVSMAGVLVSAGLAVTGWTIGRRTQAAGATVRRTGNATAAGRGSHANTGSIGAGDRRVSDTGDAAARDGGRASTGIDIPRRGR